MHSSGSYTSSLFSIVKDHYCRQCKFFTDPGCSIVGTIPSRFTLTYSGSTAASSSNVSSWLGSSGQSSISVTTATWTGSGIYVSANTDSASRSFAAYHWLYAEPHSTRECPCIEYTTLSTVALARRLTRELLPALTKAVDSLCSTWTAEHRAFVDRYLHEQEQS